MQICRQISIQSLIEIVWGRDWPGNIVAPFSLSSHWYHSGASSRASKANNDKETGAKLAISLLFQVFAFDKLLLFVYFLISDLEFGQRVKKKKRCKDSWWHTLKVSQKKSPLQKYVSVRQAGSSARSKNINTRPRLVPHPSAAQGQKALQSL